MTPARAAGTGLLRLWFAAALILGGLAAPAEAQTGSPAEAAQAAARQIEDATRALGAAEGARDRVRALTETIQGYEAGLAAMRDGLRRAALQERQLRAQLAARDTEIAELIGVLQVIGAAPTPVLMAHPDGPLGAARSGMMIAEITPGLNARAEGLRRAVEDAEALRQLQQSAADRLAEGLAGVQTARAALSQAISDRSDLPRSFVADPVQLALLIEATETLGGFATGLTETAPGPITDATPDLAALKGFLPLPVRGLLLRRAGEADAAGVTRSGILVATRPRALVTTPVAATIRYVGPLLDLGNVVILEPQSGVLFVLSGLSEVYGSDGLVIPAQTPVGLMGGNTPEIAAIASLTSDGTGTERSETLYIEVREGGSPVDPESWFQIDKDG